MKSSFVVTVYVIYLLLKLAGYFISAPDARAAGTDLSIKVLDVGQGDAILITTHNNKRILIDGGPNFEVDAYLFKEMPFRRCYLDVVILTHPHQDHEEGLNRSLLRCKAGVYGSYEDLYKGDVIRVDNVTLYVLWPERGYTDKDLNNVSVVVLLDYGKFEGLFTGDVQGKLFNRMDLDLMERLIDGSLDLYKVSHHGSKTGLNAKFFNRFPPDYSLIPVGEGNKFEHPHVETLDYFEQLGSKIYRNDLDGTIEVLVSRNGGVRLRSGL
jgi:competence protein ComEC